MLKKIVKIHKFLLGFTWGCCSCAAPLDEPLLYGIMQLLSSANSWKNNWVSDNKFLPLSSWCKHLFLTLGNSILKSWSMTLFCLFLKFASGKPTLCDFLFYLKSNGNFLALFVLKIVLYLGRNCIKSNFLPIIVIAQNTFDLSMSLL